MSKQMIIWLIIGAILITVGGVIFVGAMTVQNWDFRKLSAQKYQTSFYEITEDYGNLSIDVGTSNIDFLPSESEKCRVVCYEQKNVEHTVLVKDGTLRIQSVDTRKWYEHIGIFFTTPTLTIYLPQKEYESLVIKSSTGDINVPKDFTFGSIDIVESTGSVTLLANVKEDVKIKTSTGNISVENISPKSLDLTVSTGKVAVSNVACQDFVSNGNTGSLSLNGIIASDKIFIVRSTGDIKFDGCDAADIFVKTDTGDIKGSLLSEKVFFAESDTGKIDLPKTASGGRCEITTDTGNIKITIKP